MRLRQTRDGVEVPDERQVDEGSGSALRSLRDFGPEPSISKSHREAVAGDRCSRHSIQPHCGIAVRSLLKFETPSGERSPDRSTYFKCSSLGAAWHSSAESRLIAADLCPAFEVTDFRSNSGKVNGWSWAQESDRQTPSRC